MDGRQGRTASGRQRLYVRHIPEETALYPIIEQHAPRFFAELREKGAGLSRSAGAQTGIVTFIQRLGSALNLNSAA